MPPADQGDWLRLAPGEWQEADPLPSQQGERAG